MNQMMVSTIYANGSWFTVEGEGYRKSGAILSVRRASRCRTSRRLALGLVLDSDATVADDGAVVGDPTEAALVVLAAKLGVDAEETRRAYPRIAEVPFDSEYKFMATFHHVPDRRQPSSVIELVKGGPDVVLARCTQSGGPLSGSPGADRRGPRRHRGGERPDGREGPAGAGVRGPAGRGRRDPGDDGRPDVV